MTKKELQERFKQFAIRCFKLCEALPKSQGSSVIAYQLIKSSSSSAANYRAACRGKSKADFINKLKIVEEESDESLFWLEFISDLGLVKPERTIDLIKEANELVSIITASLKSLKFST